MSPRWLAPLQMAVPQSVVKGHANNIGVVESAVHEFVSGVQSVGFTKMRHMEPSSGSVMGGKSGRI